MKRFRIPVVAFFLPVVCVCAWPSQVFAQLPTLEAIEGKVEPACWQIMGMDQPPDMTTTIYEESTRGPVLRFFTEGEWYFSWGYSRQSWAPTNLHVSQPALGNNFTVYNMHGTDDPGFESLFGAQYNIRIGRFVDEAHTWAVEFNMDHSKYTSVTGQTARIAGTIAGKPVDANYRLDENVFQYNLLNGANHMMFNLVKRIPLYREPDENWSVAFMGKAGVGFMLPHAENVTFGYINDVGQRTLNNVVGVNSGWWRLNGWTTGVEAGLRINLMLPFYLEITDKVAYAGLSDVPVYQGTARHSLWMNEVVLSLGVTFGGR
jgi:hypothetical protein